jgi:hypothetical protein
MATETTASAAVETTEATTQEPIRIDCTLEGHEQEYVLYKRQGWRFRHYRLWEQTRDADALIPQLVERLQGWELRDEAGQPIPYVPYQATRDGAEINPEVMDGLTPDLAAWLVRTFRQAYSRSALPNPKAS